MIKYSFLLLLLFTVISCSTQKPTALPKDYWTKEPDLSKVTFEGGEGKRLETAILIKNAENSRTGIAAEYAFLTKAHGVKFVDWNPAGQTTKTVNGRKFDTVTIQLKAQNENITYYFDITEFYGKL